jgi:hypothetical protein
MARGRIGDKLGRWSEWMSLYAEAHRDKEACKTPFTPNFFLPPAFKRLAVKTEPDHRISLRQLAAAQGHHFGGEDDGRVG